MDPHRPCYAAPCARYPSNPVLRTVEELDDPGVKQEEALHVSTARVVIANYELIQNDFPELRSACLIEQHPWIATQSIDEQRMLSGQ